MNKYVFIIENFKVSFNCEIPPNLLKCQGMDTCYSLTYDEGVRILSVSDPTFKDGGSRRLSHYL